MNKYNFENNMDAEMCHSIAMIQITNLEHSIVDHKKHMKNPNKQVAANAKKKLAKAEAFMKELEEQVNAAVEYRQENMKEV